MAAPITPTYEFLSTLSLRRATVSIERCSLEEFISIHALLAESDDDLEPSKTRKLTFLSTLSLRRATRDIANGQSQKHDFYPRSPCGERRVTSSTVIVILRISIHALLAESDQKHINSRADDINFYPRSPCGERRLETHQ